MNKRIGAILTGLIFLALTAQAQAPQPAAGTTAPHRVVSPEKQPDGKITFRIAAPKASDVQLQLAAGGVRLHPMSKGSDGVWSVTIGPLEPETYNYSYSVDGLRVYAVNPDASVVDVPGTEPRFDQLQNVPHGSINIHSYFSTVQNRLRGMYIYVPPQYYSEPTRKFPVLYLWHGGGGNEPDWTRSGRTANILDNLIAAKKAVPMIIVMPNNNVLIPVEGGNIGASAVLEKELFNEIMPYVEKSYRVLTGRDNRAIAGLSAGGGTTLNVGMRRLDMFAYLGEFSAGIFGGAAPNPGAAEGEGGGDAGAVSAAGYGPYDPDKMAPGMYKNLVDPAKKLKVFWMSVGTEDPRLPFQKLALEDFQKHGIQPIFNTYSGAHEWKVWRHSLNDFAPLLFR